MAERTDITTTELGEAIADAVIDWLLHAKGSNESGAEQVFRVLERHNIWFCRISEHADGTRFEQLPLL